jgi:hypothetical protein
MKCRLWRVAFRLHDIQERSHAMSKPYVTVEMILDQFRVAAEKAPSPPDCVNSVLWLAEFLAREHATMNAGDWDALVQVGALLWRAHPPHEAWAGVPRSCDT